MVYSNRFVMAVLVNGVPSKELANGTVQLPFGSEYALRFRNKNDRRAVVKIYIDGENVSGGGYVVPANSYVDIERHHDKDSSFKFVSLESGDAIEHGKNGPNHDKVKGTIEARFFFEKPQQAKPVHVHHYHPITWPYREDPFRHPMIPPVYGQEPMHWASCAPTADIGGCTHDSFVPTSSSVLRSSASTASLNPVPKKTLSAPELKDGCTVEGTATGQTFRTTSLELEDTYTSLSVFLQGYEPAVENVRETKPQALLYVESENDKMRLEIARLENEKLKKQLEELKAGRA